MLPPEMLVSVLLYFGLAVVLLGLVATIVPPTRLRIRTRRVGAMILGAGLLIVTGMLALPATERRAAHTVTALDRVMPAWQFAERHAIRVDAPPERVFEAIRATRAKDIRLFQTLTAIRRLGRNRPEDILNAPGEKPILEVATSTTFALLADDPPHELVVGTAVILPDGVPVSGASAERLFTPPAPDGTVLAAMSFHVVADDRGSIVTTETRVFANTPGTVRRFSVYWRFIRPGSGIIRVMWLRAIRDRAERPGDAPRAVRRDALRCRYTPCKWT